MCYKSTNMLLEGKYLKGEAASSHLWLYFVLFSGLVSEGNAKGNRRTNNAS